MIDDITNSDAQAVINTAVASAEPNLLEEGGVYSLALPEGGTVQVIDLNPEDRQPVPARKKGTVRVQSGDSFVAYVKKHGHAFSEVYADRVGKKIVGVINSGAPTVASSDDPGSAGWGDHRVEFGVLLTDEWQEWAANDGKMMPQMEFAEFIEDHLSNIQVPASVDMLEIAQSLIASKSVNFESSKRLADGQVNFEYRETQEASAAKGSLDVPTTIKLGLRPFEGAPAYVIDARFRYRINQGNLALSYKLVEPELKIRDAFDALVADITEALDDQLVLDGVPADPQWARQPFQSPSV